MSLERVDLAAVMRMWQGSGRELTRPAEAVIVWHRVVKVSGRVVGAGVGVEGRG